MTISAVHVALHSFKSTSATITVVAFSSWTPTEASSSPADIRLAYRANDGVTSRHLHHNDL